MIELPEMKGLSEREQALMWIVKGNPSRIISHFHYEGTANSFFFECYCIFADEPGTVVDFSDEFTMAFGDCVLGKYRVAK